MSLNTLICLIPLIRERLLPYTIIIRKKRNNGYAIIKEYGNKIIERKTGTPYIRFSGSNRKEKFPPDDCIVFMESNFPVKFFSGYFVECTMEGDKITWIKPNIDFTNYESIDGNDMKMHVVNLEQAVDKYEQDKDKTTLEEWMPFICMFVAMGAFLLAVIWILNNGGAQIYNSIINGFSDSARFINEVNRSVIQNPIG